MNDSKDGREKAIKNKLKHLEKNISKIKQNYFLSVNGTYAILF